ncbi:MAG: hypothetical protein K8I02_07410, partial [Candidatus Methylomirabilis sp.]|nr:hypothetical protein [Deltaproteobacteria bacterium]
AGAMATPVILEKNGLGGGQVGRNLHVHPGCGVVGRFAERVNWFDGVPQGYNVDEFHDDGYLIQNFTVPLEGAAPQIAGAGLAFKDRVAEVLHFVGVGAMISEKKSSGRVEARRKGWRPKLGYRLDPVEIETFKRGLLHSGEILFAAGAEWVRPDVRGVGECRTLDALRKALSGDFKASDFTCIGNHPQGSARMSADPKRGVVSPSGEVHGTPGLWVADASLFPSSLGVNPQITIMTMATKIAGNVAAAT